MASYHVTVNGDIGSWTECQAIIKGGKEKSDLDRITVIIFDNIVCYYAK